MHTYFEADIFQEQHLSLSFMQQIEKEGFFIDWERLSKNEQLNEQVMEYYKNQLHWDTIATHVPLTEPLLEQF